VALPSPPRHFHSAFHGHSNPLGVSPHPGAGSVPETSDSIGVLRRTGPRHAARVSLSGVDGTASSVLGRLRPQRCSARLCQEDRREGGILDSGSGAE